MFTDQTFREDSVVWNIPYVEPTKQLPLGLRSDQMHGRRACERVYELRLLHLPIERGEQPITAIITPKTLSLKSLPDFPEKPLQLHSYPHSHDPSLPPCFRPIPPKL